MSRTAIKRAGDHRPRQAADAAAVGDHAAVAFELVGGGDPLPVGVGERVDAGVLGRAWPRRRAGRADSSCSAMAVTIRRPRPPAQQPRPAPTTPSRAPADGRRDAAAGRTRPRTEPEHARRQSACSTSLAVAKASADSQPVARSPIMARNPTTKSGTIGALRPPSPDSRC